MPYVDIISNNDYASIWYITNSLWGNVGSFQQEKSTVMMLHPLFMDATWLRNQFEDPRLNHGYNIIALDSRCSGKSRCRPSNLHDSWVEAADLAFAHQALHLPPVHILALESMSVMCALRFAALFPEMCLSLTLCNVPPPTELKWVFNAYDELLQAWCYTDDLDSFEHTGMEAVSFVAGPDCDADLQDELIAYWQVHFPPCRRLRTVELVNVVLNRMPLKAKELASITQPVLIIQGERCEACPVKYAEKLASDLVNAQNGAIVYVVKGAVGCLSIVHSSASILNQVFTKFLKGLPHVKSTLVAPQVPILERMKLALEKLAEFAGDSSISHRDPSSPLSFSCVSPEVRSSQLETLELYAKDQDNAFSPLGVDGRPLRKFSERQEEHWFHGERDGSSYAWSDLVTAQQRSKRDQPEQDRSEIGRHLPHSEPVSLEVAQDGRMRRATFNPKSVDKLVIKGSMSKVAASTGMPLQRLIM